MCLLKLLNDHITNYEMITCPLS